MFQDLLYCILTPFDAVVQLIHSLLWCITLKTSQLAISLFQPILSKSTVFENLALDSLLLDVLILPESYLFITMYAYITDLPVSFKCLFVLLGAAH